jgi:NAD(P)-dependent dehydrogenase (short-subunit alcohol dehydrogenase family)
MNGTHKPVPKSIVVTGGASGIGLGMVRLFASQGHQVAILDINAATGEKLVTELAVEFPTAILSFHKCDVSSWREQEAVFANIFREHGGRIDIVMANAGISEQGTSTAVDLQEDTPSEPSLRTVNVNFLGVIYSMLYTIWHCYFACLGEIYLTGRR